MRKNSQAQEIFRFSEPQTTAIGVPQSDFGGPASVVGQIAEDALSAQEYHWQNLQDLFEPWHEFKSNITNETGLTINLDESIFYQYATDSPGRKEGAAGLVRLYGQWELLPSETGDTGSLVFKIENRHRMGDTTPFDLGFEAGSIVPTGTFFNAIDSAVTNLFWKQHLFDKQMAIAVGRIDVTDYIDLYAMANPLTHFINLAFSLNPTIAAPNQGLGVVAAGMLTDHIYVQGGVADANGQPTVSGFDTFFDASEYFSYLEMGATTSQDRIYFDNVHFTLWHTDARAVAGAPSGNGVTFSAQKFVNDRWLPFFRCGYADGDASLMQTTFTTGLGFVRRYKDVCGVGISWGAPANGALRTQFTSEIFYRYQLTQLLAITPDIQIIANPRN